MQALECNPPRREPSTTNTKYPDVVRVPCNAVQIASERNSDPGTTGDRVYRLVTRDVQLDSDNRVVMRLTIGVVPDVIDSPDWIDGHLVLSPTDFTASGTLSDGHTCQDCGPHPFREMVSISPQHNTPAERVTMSVEYTSPDRIVDAAICAATVLNGVA